LRREIPLFITFLVGVIFLFGPITTGDVPLVGMQFREIVSVYLSPWTTIISAFAIGLASVNLLRLHGNYVARKRPGWINSAALVFSMLFFTVARTVRELMPADPEVVAFYSLIFDHIAAPLSGAMFAILAFYIASASYRAFRARSLEASVLLLAAIVVMLGAAPVGALIWDYFPSLQRWLLAVPNTAGQRAIIIGAAVGGFATSLRILFGLERGYLGGE